MKALVGIGSGSGGAGSRYASLAWGERHGFENLTMVFADVLGEDADTLAVVDGTSREVVEQGGQAVKLTDGRDVWDVFDEVAFIGNSRIDPCSRVLKRQVIRWWLDENYEEAAEQGTAVEVIIGYDSTERNRQATLLPRYEPYRAVFPLDPGDDAPASEHVHKWELLARLKADGYSSFLYDVGGFSHSNCSGFCVKAGQVQMRRLLETRPLVFAYHERREQQWRKLHGKDQAVLRWRSGPKKGLPFPLTEFRELIEARNATSPRMFTEADYGWYDPEDYGDGCSCMSGGPDEADALTRLSFRIPRIDHWCLDCDGWARPGSHVHVRSGAA